MVIMQVASGELWAAEMEEALKMGFFFVRIPCSDVSVNRVIFVALNGLGLLSLTWGKVKRNGD